MSDVVVPNELPQATKITCLDCGKPGNDWYWRDARGRRVGALFCLLRHVLVFRVAGSLPCFFCACMRICIPKPNLHVFRFA
jgi:hypothetical protein